MYIIIFMYVYVYMYTSETQTTHKHTQRTLTPQIFGVLNKLPRANRIACVEYYNRVPRALCTYRS